MKKGIKKSTKTLLAFVLAFALISALVFNCFSMISFADAPVYSYTDFTTTAGQKAVTDDFTLYTASNAPKEGFSLAKFGSAFCFNGGVLQKNASSSFTSDQFWKNANEKFSTLYFNKGDFEEFTITARVQGNGAAINNDDIRDWFLPTFVFGVQDPNAYHTADSGLSAFFNFNPGGDTSYLGFGQYDQSKGEWVDKLNSTAVGFYGGKYVYIYTLTVKDGKATLSCHFDGGWTTPDYTYTIDLPASYKAGAVGIQFLDVSYLITSITVQGDVVPESTIDEDPGEMLPDVTVYDLTNADGQSNFKADFDIYGADNAAEEGFKRVAFADRFAMKNSALELTYVKNATGDLFWQNVDKSLTRIMYNKGKLDNFTLEFRVEGNSTNQNADWVIPQIVFGSQDPKLYSGKDSGVIAGNIFNPGGSFSTYYMNCFDSAGQQVSIQDTEGNPMYGGKYTYYYRLKVKDKKATLTVTLDDSWEQVTSYTVDLTDYYVPGAVGIQLYSSKTRITSVSVIGDVIPSSTIDPNPGEDPDAPDIYEYKGFDNTDNQDALKADFNVYHSSAATTDGALEKVDFADYFNFDGTSLYKKLADGTTTANFWDNYDQEITTLVFNKGDLDEFEFSANVCGIEGEFGSMTDYFMPGVLFGIKDPNNFHDSKSGAEAFVNFNPGQDSFLGISSYDTNTKAYASKLDTVGSGHCGGKYDCIYKVKVGGGKVTYSISQFDGSVTYTKDFNIPSSYVAGGVGLLFRSAAYRISNIKITGKVIADSVVDPEPGAEEDEEGGGTGDGGDEDEPVGGETVSYSDFGSTAVQEKLEEDFKVYHSDNAGEGLVEQNFSDYFEYSSPFLKHKPSAKTYPTANDWLSDRWGNVTSLVYDKKPMDYFELTVVATGSNDDSRGIADFFIPELMFGIQDPTLWMCDGSGYEASVSFNPGNVSPLFIRGYDVPDCQLNTYSSGQTNYCGGKYECIYKVRVYNEKITVSYSQFDGAAAGSYTFDMPSSYAPGKIGVMFPADAITVRSISITDLGERETPYVRPVAVKKYYGNFSQPAQRAALEADFDIYHGENAITDLHKVPFSDWFSYEGNNVRHKESVHYTDAAQFQTDAGRIITTMVYNKQKFVNFEIRARIQGSNNPDLHDAADYLIPRMLFGITTPTEWTFAGAGWKCMPIFVPYEVSRAFLRGYDKESDSVITEKLEKDAAYYYGGKYNYDYIIRVENGKVTFKTVHAEWGSVNEDVFDVPEDYKGGAVGIAFSSDAAILQEISITNLDTAETAFVEGAYEADIKGGDSENDNPTNPTDSSNTSTGGNTTSGNTGSTETGSTATNTTGKTIPKNGESNTAVVWLAILLVSGGTFASVIYFRRRARQQ